MRTQLRLDEALDDTPQLRSLLKLFEEDSGNLRQWCRALDSALVRLTTAQTEIAAATAHLSAVVAAYQDQRLPLEQTELDMPDVTGRLTQTIGEVGSWMEVASQQLSNSVVFPVRRLLTELDQLHNVHKPMFHDCRTALTDAEERFAKAGRKDAPRKLEEVNNDVFLAKQNFHQAALVYYSHLNGLQFLRYTHVVEPLLALVYAFRSFFTTGHEGLKVNEVTSYLTRTQEQVQSVHSEHVANRTAAEKDLQSFAEVRKVNRDMYYGESPHSDQLPANDQLCQKQGCVWVKSKSGLVFHNWDAYFLFTQGAYLMWQGKDALAGQLLVDLTAIPGTSAEVVTTVDRRFVFAINVPPAENGGKPIQWLIQARNTHDCAEWVALINNLSGHSPRGSPSKRPPTLSVAMPTVADRSFASATDTPVNTPVTADAFPPSGMQPIQFDLIRSQDEMPDGDASPLPNESSNSSTFDVRFLGCMEVLADRGERMVDETIRQIMEARAKHNIFAACEIRLTVDLDRSQVRLKDAGTGMARAVFRLADISYWSTHRDNEFLLAFIARSTPENAAAVSEQRHQPHSRPRFTCYVMEAHKNGAEVCAALAEGTKRAFQSLVADKRRQSLEQQQQPVVTTNGASGENDGSPPPTPDDPDTLEEVDAPDIH